METLKVSDESRVKRQRITPKKIETARKLRAMGLRWSEVAARLKVSVSAISQHAKTDPTSVRDERIRRILALRLDGKTVTDIALRLDLSLNTVRYYLRLSGLDPNVRKSMTPEQIETGLELRRNGLTWQDVAKRLGVPYATVYGALKHKVEK